MKAEIREVQGQMNLQRFVLFQFKLFKSAVVPLERPYHFAIHLEPRENNAL